MLDHFIKVTFEKSFQVFNTVLYRLLQAKKKCLLLLLLPLTVLYQAVETFRPNPHVQGCFQKEGPPWFKRKKNPVHTITVVIYLCWPTRKPEKSQLLIHSGRPHSHRVESCVELFLHLLLTQEASQTQENVDWESCQSENTNTPAPPLSYGV